MVCSKRHPPPLSLGLQLAIHWHPAEAKTSQHSCTNAAGTQDSLWKEQLKVNPESTTAIQTPAANYDCSTISKIGTKFGTGPRSYGWDSDPNSPNKGLGKGPGPYIGRLHEHSQLGTQSPGPCAYGSVVDSPRSKAVGGWIGDSPKYSFGTAPQTQPL
eukprot:scaffold35543_cov16-Tisochrysis_lutea.AAC.1